MPIRPFSHLANAAVVLQKILLAHNASSIQHNANHPLTTQAPKEKVSLELRKE